jgi:hypothetical protein
MGSHELLSSLETEKIFLSLKLMKKQSFNAPLKGAQKNI